MAGNLIRSVRARPVEASDALQQCRASQHSTICSTSSGNVSVSRAWTVLVDSVYRSAMGLDELHRSGGSCQDHSR